MIWSRLLIVRNEPLDVFERKHLLAIARDETAGRVTRQETSTPLWFVFLLAAASRHHAQNIRNWNLMMARSGGHRKW
jgi:hypothetical protein